MKRNQGTQGPLRTKQFSKLHLSFIIYATLSTGVKKSEGYSHHMSFPLIFRCMQVPEGPRHFALRLNVQIGTEAYPGVQGAFFPGKIGGGVNLTTYLRLVPR